MAKQLAATIVNWGANRTLHRVHPGRYRPEEFNHGTLGSARFSPLLTAEGRVVPTIYAATTIDGALMETVFHDVPYAKQEGHLRTISKTTHIAGKVRSSLSLSADLRLVDLRSVALVKLGIAKTELIETEASHYEVTRRLALELYEQNPDAQGLLWISRRDDTAESVILFEDRMPGALLRIVNDSTPLLDPNENTVDPAIDSLRERLEVDIVP